MMPAPWPLVPEFVHHWVLLHHLVHLSSLNCGYLDDLALVSEAVHHLVLVPNLVYLLLSHLYFHHLRVLKHCADLRIRMYIDQYRAKILTDTLHSIKNKTARSITGRKSIR